MLLVTARKALHERLREHGAHIHANREGRRFSPGPLIMLGQAGAGTLKRKLIPGDKPRFFTAKSRKTARPSTSANTSESTSSGIFHKARESRQVGTGSPGGEL